MQKNYFNLNVNWLSGAILFAAALLIQTNAVAVEFTVTSDPHNQIVNFEGVLNGIVAPGNPGMGDFHVTCGDLETPADIRSIIDTFFGNAAVWFPVVGNHDADSTSDMEWLRNEYNNANGSSIRQPLNYWIGNGGPTNAEETCYSWDWDNAHFIVLNVYYNGSDDHSGSGDIHPDLYLWLEADLAANDKPFVFVFGHEPAYPKCRHETDCLDIESGGTNRDNLWTLLNNYNVNAYFSGHTHFYWAEQPSGYAWSSNPAEATWQIVAGHAGLRYDPQPGTVCTDQDDYTFLHVDVSDDIVTYNTYRAEHHDSPYNLYESWSQSRLTPPDLSISASDISLNPPSPQNPGTNIDITATIHNDGETDATCDVSVWYTSGTIYDFTGVSVTAGATTDVTSTWDTTGLSTTTYPIYVTISNSDPAEAVTGNNEAHTDYALPIELAAVSAKRIPNGSVEIRWQTASETLNKGWNIWRKLKGGVDSWEIINGALIPGAATAPFGEEYQFIDNSTNSHVDYLYRLEWISSNGKKEQSGTISIGQQAGAFLSLVSEDIDDDAHTDSLTTNKAKAVAETNWRSPYHRADYLIITTEKLKESVEALASFRRTQGFYAQVVTVEEIYTLFQKFSNNETAIRLFLRHAYQSWDEPKLKYVLLVGDAEMDQDGQIYSNNFVPTFVRRMPSVGKIPTDYPFTFLDGADEIPDVTIGRIPARNPRTIDTIIKKIIRYEHKQMPGGSVVFANGDYVMPGDEYAEASSEDIIAEYIEGKYAVTRIYTTPISDSLQKYTGGSTELEHAFNTGCNWLEFRGHGAASVWAGLMTSASVRNLIPSRSLPIITSVSCFTGSFADSKQRMSIAEALLAHPSGGAMAYIGNTGHGMVFTGHDFSSELWGQIETGETRIGDAIFNTKKYLSQTGSNKGFLHSINLLGDPALTIKLRSRK